MYSEINLIQNMSNAKDRINLYLEFIREYSGWLQHLKDIGIFVESPIKEHGKCQEHLEKLRTCVLNELI